MARLQIGSRGSFAIRARARVLSLLALACVVLIGCDDVKDRIRAARRPIPSCPNDSSSRTSHFAEQARQIFLESKFMDRDENGFELWDTWVGDGWRPGQYWIPRGNGSALAYMLAEKQADVYGDRERGVRKDDVVLDAGANVGVFVNKALERRAKLVVAIELSPKNVDVLEKTFAAEIASGKVIVYPKGVWHEDDEITLRVTDVSWRDSVAFSERGDAGPTVQLTTIDKMVEELGLEKVDFIKMDIEGAELNALKGAVKTLQRFKPRIAVTYESRQDDIETIPAGVLEMQPEYELCAWGQIIMFE